MDARLRGAPRAPYLDPGVHLFFLLQPLFHPLFLLLLQVPGRRRELCGLLRAAPLQRRVHTGSRNANRAADFGASGGVAAAAGSARAVSPQPGTVRRRRGRHPGGAARRCGSRGPRLSGGNGRGRPLSAAAVSAAAPAPPSPRRAALGAVTVCSQSQSPRSPSQKPQLPERLQGGELGQPAPLVNLAARWITNSPPLAASFRGSVPPPASARANCMEGKFGVFPLSEVTLGSLYSVTLDQFQDSLKSLYTSKASFSPWVNLGNWIYLKSSPRTGN